MFADGAFPKEDSVSTARIKTVYADSENIGLALHTGLRDLVPICLGHSNTSCVGGVNIGDDAGCSRRKSASKSCWIEQGDVPCGERVVMRMNQCS